MLKKKKNVEQERSRTIVRQKRKKNGPGEKGKRRWKLNDVPRRWRRSANGRRGKRRWRLSGLLGPVQSKTGATTQDARGLGGRGGSPGRTFPGCSKRTCRVGAPHVDGARNARRSVTIQEDVAPRV